MQLDDIKAWKTSKRKELLSRRQDVTDSERQVWNSAVTRNLIDGFPQLEGLCIGIYWPYQGEFDPRPAGHHFRQLGATTALPEVLRKAEPLQFRAWWPGVAMGKGVFEIAVPDGTDIVVPQVLIMPPLGFDAAGYRLGYGGGFYDRTLASIKPRPLTIGVAYELSRLPTIHPQAFDQKMDYVITERGIFKTEGIQSAT
jgi:5,10-methenyltetrahydrofolate synthetase